MSAVSRLFSAELDGIDARLIEVETDINVGLHSFTIVGLADKSLSEAKERVNSALKNIGVKPPTRENRRIVVNLAPADVQKTGSQYDLAIALGYLIASGQLAPFDSARALFVGELSLEGNVRAINGALSTTHLAHERGFSHVFVPAANAPEAAIVTGVTVIPVHSLGQLIEHLEGRRSINPQPITTVSGSEPVTGVDFCEIRGQEYAKRALTIAAAGGHNLLMVGPPGTGKTMLASSLASILPPLTLGEVIEVTKIYSCANLLGEKSFVAHRPFRSPHQSASPAAVIGGGSTPRPGEISLAHRGILFLDELPEFRRDILESLRQPIERGTAIISRARANLTVPAKFTLITAMNPCPCGYYGDPEKECSCSAFEVIRYQKKVSGPLLDRIDIQIPVPRIKVSELRATTIDRGTTARVREQVLVARERQHARLARANIKHKFTNAELSSKECDQAIALDEKAETFAQTMFDKALVSGRGYYRILKVAQTIADLAGAATVSADHLAEAFNYRLREGKTA